MNDEAGDTASKEAVAWARACLDEACITVSGTGMLEGITFDARVAWTLPNRIVIGQLRDTGPHLREFWVISGEVPTDCIDASTSATPRDAARHFALKWQLGAEQLRDPNSERDPRVKALQNRETAADELQRVAAELYVLADEDLAWKSALTNDA